MNKDQVKGTLKDIGGKIQEEAGKVVGNRNQEAKGLEKQVEGKVQKKGRRRRRGHQGPRQPLN